MTTAYDKVTFHGHTVTRRQRQALRHVEQNLNLDLAVFQGSWAPRTSYSGTTHTGAGVCDLWVPGMDNDERLRRRITRALREDGRQAAFLRGPLDHMPWHWHTVDLDTVHMDPNAAWQADQYRLGNDGLTPGHPDRNPYRPDPIRKWRYIEPKGTP